MVNIICQVKTQPGKLYHEPGRGFGESRKGQGPKPPTEERCVGSAVQFTPKLLLFKPLLQPVSPRFWAEDASSSLPLVLFPLSSKSLPLFPSVLPPPFSRHGLFCSCGYIWLLLPGYAAGGRKGVTAGVSHNMPA